MKILFLSLTCEDISVAKNISNDVSRKLHSAGVFNINLAPAKNEVKSPEVDSKRKKRRLIIESDSSQESTT